MPIYEFKCRVCDVQGGVLRAWGDTQPPQCECGGSMKRVFSPPAVKVYQPHVQTIGDQTVEVQSDRHHRDLLKYQSEAQSARTGIPHNFVPVHPADAKDVYGITEEGLDTTYRREVAEGKKDVKLWL